MAIKTLFPTFLYEKTLASPAKVKRLNDEILREAYILRELDWEGQDWSQTNYIGGYTSYASVTDLHTRATTFEQLRRLVDSHVREYTRFLEMDLQGGKLEMSTCWLNIMPRHTHHSGHIHPLSVISGTYYVSIPRGSGALKFEDPRLGFMMAAPPKIEPTSPPHRRVHTIKPRAGQVILFESWMRHEVPANTATRDRISVSFNYDWQ